MAMVDAFSLVGRIGLEGGKNVERGLTNIQKKVQATNKKFKEVGQSMKNFGSKLTLGVTLPIVAGGGAMLNLASDMEETQGKFNVVFGDMKDEMEDWSKKHSDAFGRSQTDLKNYLAETQNTLVGFGMARDEGAEFSKQIVGLGVDLASFNNLAEEDALRNLRSAISGNHGAVESLGAVLNETTLQRTMEREGIQGQFKDLSEEQKMRLRYNTIVSQSTDALGDAERTSDSYANQVRRLQGQVKDLAGEFGQVLLPIFTEVVEWLNGLMENFSGLSDEQKQLILTIGGIVAILPPIIMFLGLMATAIGSIGLPVALAIAGILGFIGVMTSLYQNNEQVREKIQTTWQTIKDLFFGLVSFFQEMWDLHGQTLVDGIMFAWEQVKLGFGAVMTYLEEKFALLLEFWNTYGEQFKEAIGGFLSFMQGIFEVVFPIVKAIFIDTWNSIKGFLDGVFQVIGGLVKVFTGIFTGDFGLAWEGVKDIFLGGVKAVWNFINLWIVGKVLKLFKTFGTKAKKPFTDLWDKIKTSVQSIKDTVKGFIDDIIGFFKGLGGKLGFSIPKPKLPKFKLEGKLDLVPPGISIPKLSWHEKGGIFESPTIAGLGENGREGIIPLENTEYMKPFALAIADELGGVNMNQGIEVPVYLNGREIARAMSNNIDGEIERNRRMKARMKGGQNT